MQRRLVVFALTLVLACPVVASDGSEDREQPEKGERLWWTITALYGASVALLVLEQQHRQPCDVNGCKAGRRTSYRVGATASMVAGLSLNLWEIRRVRHGVVVGMPARSSAASVGYSLKW